MCGPPYVYMALVGGAHNAMLQNSDITEPARLGGMQGGIVVPFFYPLPFELDASLFTLYSPLLPLPALTPSLPPSSSLYPLPPLPPLAPFTPSTLYSLHFNFFIFHIIVTIFHFLDNFSKF